MEDIGKLRPKYVEESKTEQKVGSYASEKSSKKKPPIP